MTISKYFNLFCAKKLQSLSFRKTNKTFARIRGDVLQTLTFKQSQRAPICSVEFGIFPLCMPTPIYIFAGGYELYKFIVEIYEKDSGWMFDPHSEKSIETCIESILQAIETYLLPFFDVCFDCGSSLKELIKLEELFDRNRKEVLKIRGTPDCGIPWKEASLFDSRKYYMALKSQDLSYAKQYLCHQIIYYKEQLNLFDDPDSFKQPEHVKEKFAAKLNRYADELEYINSGNWQYFAELLLSNEREMKTYITTRYPKLWGM